MLALAIASDNLIQLDELQDTDGRYVADAAVSARLLDADGKNVAGAEAIALAHVAGSGRYEGILSYHVALVDGARYLLEIVATWGDKRRTFRVACVAQYMD